MKEYSVTFVDGQSHTLKYTLDSRESLEGAFPRADGTPSSMWELVQGHLVRNGSFKVQTAIVQAGLQHLSPKNFSLERVREKMIASAQAGELKQVLLASFQAILASGVLGFVVDPTPAEESEDPGKAAAPTS